MLTVDINALLHKQSFVIVSIAILNWSFFSILQLTGCDEIEESILQRAYYIGQLPTQLSAETLSTAASMAQSAFYNVISPHSTSSSIYNNSVHSQADLKNGDNKPITSPSLTMHTSSQRRPKSSDGVSDNTSTSHHASDSCNSKGGSVETTHKSTPSLSTKSERLQDVITHLFNQASATYSSVQSTLPTSLSSVAEKNSALCDKSDSSSVSSLSKKSDMPTASTSGNPSVLISHSLTHKGVSIANSEIPNSSSSAENVLGTRSNTNSPLRGAVSAKPVSNSDHGRSSSSKGSASGSIKSPEPLSGANRAANVAGPSKMSSAMPIGFDKFGAVYYDYSLPDRGLGQTRPSRNVTISPSCMSPAASAVCFYPNGLPSLKTPVDFSACSPSLDSSGAATPLDLSASACKESAVSSPHRKSSKASEKLTEVRRNTPVLDESLDEVKTPLSSRSVSVVTSTPTPPPASLATVSGEKQDVSQSKATVPTLKTPYERHFLIFGDNELEIISVGKNKWIVRNELELCRIAKEEVKKLGSPSPEESCSKSSTDKRHFCKHSAKVVCSNTDSCSHLNHSSGDSSACSGFKCSQSPCCSSPKSVSPQHSPTATSPKDQKPACSNHKRANDSPGEFNSIAAKVPRSSSPLPYSVTASPKTNSVCNDISTPSNGADASTTVEDSSVLSTQSKSASIVSNDCLSATNSSPLGEEETRQGEAVSSCEESTEMAVAPVLSSDSEGSKCPTLQRMLKTT